MLQQNWARIEAEKNGVTVYFVDDLGIVFDYIAFSGALEARRGLLQNGFKQFASDDARFLAPPEGFALGELDPKGQIYSSGKYWK